MLKNNNQKAVKRIGIRSMKNNRMRNIFAVLAIILTTFMFTTVFSIGFSLAENMSTMLLRQAGTRSEIFLMYPTAEQIEQAKRCSALDHAGTMIPVGKALPLDGEEFEILMKYHDEEDFVYNIMPAMSDVKGKYPMAENEIMLSLDGLKALKINSPKIGMDIRLESEGTSASFVLTGYFRNYDFGTNYYEAYVSETYAINNGLTVEKDGMLSMSAKSFMRNKLLEQLESSITLTEKQGFDISFDTDENDNIVIAAIVILTCLIIVVSGYLLIYNIMYISVSRDIRFYGMLKTIGTTPKQIRQIVRMQAFRLSVVGIPIGIVLGMLVSFAAVPFAMQFFSSSYNTMPSNISFHPFIFLGTIIFAAVTVALSCRKPAKIAGKVSPIEALKYNGQSNAKIKSKKTTEGGKLHKMAFRNVFREKKRAFFVLASFLMGTLALFATQSFIGSMKFDNYASYYVPDDYAIFPTCELDDDFETVDRKKAEAAEKLAEDIKNIDGITQFMCNRSADVNLLFDKEVYMPFLENGAVWSDISLEEMIEIFERDRENSYSTQVIGVDRAMIERHNEKTEHKIDVDAFERGEICFVQFVSDESQAAQLAGKTITLINPETEKRRDIKIGVCGVDDDRYGFNLAYYAHVIGSPECILVSQGVIDELTDRPCVEGILASCEPNREAQITKQIKQLTENNICVASKAHIQIKSETLEDFQSSMVSMNILTAGISFILILIGVINFINVMLTGVFARRRELAVMESIGMTKKQIRKMLMLEGVYYGTITALLILTVGSAIVYAVAKTAEMATDYAVFCYPWQLMLMMTGIIMLICVGVPAIVYGQISKESVTERLRIGE